MSEADKCEHTREMMLRSITLTSMRAPQFVGRALACSVSIAMLMLLAPSGRAQDTEIDPGVLMQPGVSQLLARECATRIADVR